MHISRVHDTLPLRRGLSPEGEGGVLATRLGRGRLISCLRGAIVPGWNRCGRRFGWQPPAQGNRFSRQGNGSRFPDESYEADYVGHSRPGARVMVSNAGRNRVMAGLRSELVFAALERLQRTLMVAPFRWSTAHFASQLLPWPNAPCPPLRLVKADVRLHLMVRSPSHRLRT